MKGFARFGRIAALCALCCVMYVATTPVKADELVRDMLLEVVVPAGADYVVVDVMDGVEARYRTMATADIYGEYSCAGYVKAYYEAVYGIAVMNLTDLGPPSPTDQFIQVSTPQKGDLIFYPSPPNRNNHSAIVKTFDGTRITLIEQNYKWAQSNGTYTYLNRTIPFPPDNDNIYEIWRPVFVSDEPETEGDALSDPQPLPAGPDVNAVENPNDPSSVKPSEPEPTFTYEAVVMIGRMYITVNGVDRPIDAPALIENNRTIMPVRWVGYALGLQSEDLQWNQTDRSVTVYNGDVTVRFTIGSDVLYINEQPLTMDCAAMIKPGGHAYLPVAYLAQALGVSYDWDSSNAGVTFYK